MYFILFSHAIYCTFCTFPQESSAPAPGRKKGLLKNLQRRKNNAQKSDPVIPKPVEISVEDLTSSDVGAGTDKRHVHKSQSDSQLSSHNNARCDETDGKRELNHSSDYKSSSSSEKLATPLPHLKHIKSESAVQDLIKVEKKTGSSPRSRRKKSESSLSARRSDDQSNGDHAKPALIKVSFVETIENKKKIQFEIIVNVLVSFIYFLPCGDQL